MWITTAEAVKLSGYHAVYLLELLRTGKVKGRKFGVVWQVDRTNLLAYVRAAEKSSDGRRGSKKRG